jgi:Arc/MetJ-type ribon-helix-helix transcriptional regulator
LNEAVTTEEPEKIREALERLRNSSMEIGKAIYSQQDSSAGSEDTASSEGTQEETKEEEKKDEEKKDDEKK